MKTSLNSAQNQVGPHKASKLKLLLLFINHALQRGEVNS